MRQARIVSLLTLLVGICATAPLQPPQSSTTRPPLPAATGPRYPKAAQSPHPDTDGAKFVTSKQLTRDQMEQFLLNAKIVAEKPIQKGITHTMRITLSDGRMYHDAHVQQIDVYK